MNKEEKEYNEFLQKLGHSLTDLQNNFSKLSYHNKVRIRQQTLRSLMDMYFINLWK